jgi:hypothetical protein
VIDKILLRPSRWINNKVKMLSQIIENEGNNLLKSKIGFLQKVEGLDYKWLHNNNFDKLSTFLIFSMQFLNL